jgi:hypothetical protein
MGVYAVHIIPGETSWVIICSRNSISRGSFTYDQAEDALRVTVKPRSIQNYEVLSYGLRRPETQFCRDHHALGKGSARPK